MPTTRSGKDIGEGTEKKCFITAVVAVGVVVVAAAVLAAGIVGEEAAEVVRGGGRRGRGRRDEDK